jgi:GH25 family lysozyme M1 (1,4-beta-N-acetylmuramidase)
MTPLQNAPDTPLAESDSTSSLPATNFLRVVVLALAFVGVSLAVSFVASSVTATPASAVITGIDIASYQHPNGAAIDWQQVAGAGHKFAYVKASEGPLNNVGDCAFPYAGYTPGNYRNPYFAGDWDGAASAGLYRGAYHFARPQFPLSSAEEQARYFVSIVGSSTGGLDLPMELDLEVTCGLGQADLAEWTRRFLAEVTRMTGKHPLVYTGRWFWQGNIGSFGNDIGQNYRLWTADYRCQRQDGSLFCDPSTDTYNPPIYGGWGQWTFWQNYSVGVVPGIRGDVDMNRFCCDVASLQALAGGGNGGSPFGILHSISVPEPTYLNVFGWAIDPDSRSPIPVDVYVYGPDGQPGMGRRLDASGEFPGLADAYPGFGGAHAFFTSMPIPLGAKQVCAFGINVGLGGNSLLGCKSLGGDPYGVIDTARAAGPGRIEVKGWAIDPNGVTPTQVVARVNGVDTVVTANENRPDLGNPSGLGNLHGYTTTVLVPSGGNVQICMGASNSIGPGSSASLGCRTVALPGGSPVGVIDTAISGVGSVSVTGWVVDPDTAAAIDVHVYVDGVGRVALRADGIRNDVAAGFPGYGATRGYSGSVSVRGGTHSVCVYGINVGVGTNVLLACRNVQVNGGAPFGALDTATLNNGAIQVTGWAVDPDTAASIPVHVYLDSQGYAITADGNRPDIAGGLPAYGAAHGFSGQLPAPEGTHSICAYAIDAVGGDGNRLLGCKTVNVPAGNPVGFVDGASIVNGNVTLNGWAIDPNTANPDIVHVYVNGVGFEIIANGSRPDLGNPWGLGSNHGWSFSTARIGSGNQNVCVYALNIAGSGSHQLLGCRNLS